MTAPGEMHDDDGEVRGEDLPLEPVVIPEYVGRPYGIRRDIFDEARELISTANVQPRLREAFLAQLDDPDSPFSQALADGQGFAAAAQAAAGDAALLVEDAGDIMDAIDGSLESVLTAHGQVLTLHGQAITAAAGAAGDAASAAAQALLASEYAADALVLFEAQQIQIDEEQNARLDLHQQVIDAIRGVEGAGLVAHQGRIIKSDSGSRSDSYVSIASGGQAQTITALGSWTGVIRAAYARAENGYQTYGVRKYQLQVPDSGGSRTYTIPNFGENQATFFTDLDLDYQVNPGTQKTRDLTGGSVSASQGSWTTLGTHSWTAPSGATRVAVNFRAGWDAVPFIPTYGVRILVNGTVVKSLSRYNIGPLIGNSYRNQSVSYNGITPGSTVTFQVFTDASLAHERVVRNTETRISWIET